MAETCTLVEGYEPDVVTDGVPAPAEAETVVLVAGIVPLTFTAVLVLAETDPPVVATCVLVDPFKVDPEVDTLTVADVFAADPEVETPADTEVPEAEVVVVARVTGAVAVCAPPAAPTVPPTCPVEVGSPAAIAGFVQRSGRSRPTAPLCRITTRRCDLFRCSTRGVPSRVAGLLPDRSNEWIQETTSIGLLAFPSRTVKPSPRMGPIW